jgi:ABC-2 type transport system permease protein
MNARRIKGMFLKNWYTSITKIEKFFDITFWPLLDLFLWAFVAVFINQLNADLNLYTVFLGAVFLWMIFMRCSQDAAVYVLEDFWNKTLHNLFVSPITEAEIFVSTILFTFLRTLVASIILFTVSLFALHFNLFALDWPSIVILYVPLMLYGWAIGFFLAGLLFRFGERISTFVWALPWLLQPFSCVFYTVSSLPSWMQVIAKINPLTAVFEGFRAVISSEPIGHYVLYSYLGSLVILVLSLFFFIHSIRHSRKSGLLARS